jgi:hypothetical protein
MPGVPSFADTVVKPDTEWIEEVGVQVLAQITSATRPANGYPGRMCFEIDTNRFILDDGIGWLGWDLEWQTYTPTFTNVTLGTGGSPSVAGVYKRRWNSALVSVEWKLGTTGEASGDIRFSSPLEMATDPLTATAAVRLKWPCTFTDSGVRTYLGYVYDVSTTSFRALALDTVAATDTNVYAAVSSSTVPFTWADNDEFYMPPALVDVAAADLYL